MSHLPTEEREKHGEENMSFKQYLQQYEIDAVTLSIAAKVRYVTAWNARQGNALTPEDAQKIKAAVHTLTGVACTGSFRILQYKHQILRDRLLCPRLVAEIKKKGTYRDGRIINGIRGCTHFTR